MTPHYIIMRLRYNGLGHFRGSWEGNSSLRTVNLIEFAQMSKINVLNCLDEEIPHCLGSRHYAVAWVALALCTVCACGVAHFEGASPRHVDLKE